MPDLKESGYDQIQLANGTRAEVEAAKSKLNTFEPVIITDEDKFAYKDAQGNLKDVAFGDSNELRGLIEQNKSDIEQNKSDIEQNKSDIEQNKSDILLKMDKDNTTYPYLELTGHDNSFIDFARNSGKDYESRLIQTDNGLVLENSGVGGTNGLIWHSGDCPISKSQTGWCKLANGMIMQWGRLSNEQSNVVTLTFPISFSSGASYSISMTKAWVDESVGGPPIQNAIGVFEQNTVNCKIHFGNVVNGDRPLLTNWIAIGY